jgi:hypothetical protein
VWRSSVETFCGNDSDLLQWLLGPTGVLTMGSFPVVEKQNISNHIDLQSSKYELANFVELASKMHDDANQNPNWTVEADMQLSELITRVANRERVTPQNLTSFAMETALVVDKAIDLKVTSPLLFEVPMRRLLARACILRTANQALSYVMPYLSVSLPEEMLQYNRSGVQEGFHF